VALVVLSLVIVGLVIAVVDPSRRDGRWSRAVRKAGGPFRAGSARGRGETGGDRGETGWRVAGHDQPAGTPVDPGTPLARRAVEPDGARSLPPARRLLGVAYRATWSAPLAIVLLFVAHWGVVTAYLPQRAEAAGANVGLFFAADGIAVLLMRVPSGWLADRFAALRLVLAGIAITAAGVALLLLPPTTPLLVVAGIATGGGAALIVTPLLLELTRRSSEADRGSAFALFSAGFAAAIALGSIGAAPIVAGAGFEVAVAVAMIGLGLAAVVAVLDGGLRLRVRAAGG
jgi:predicted MFS family arabinose efflux permease